MSYEFNADLHECIVWTRLIILKVRFFCINLGIAKWVFLFSRVVHELIFDWTVFWLINEIDGKLLESLVLLFCNLNDNWDHSVNNVVLPWFTKGLQFIQQCGFLCTQITNFELGIFFFRKSSWEYFQSDHDSYNLGKLFSGLDVQYEAVPIHNRYLPFAPLNLLHLENWSKGVCTCCSGITYGL